MRAREICYLYRLLALRGGEITSWCRALRCTRVFCRFDGLVSSRLSASWGGAAALLPTAPRRPDCARDMVGTWTVSEPVSVRGCIRGTSFRGSASAGVQGGDVTNLGQWWREMRFAPTWTERVYLLSPALMAVLKDAAIASHFAEWRNRASTVRMAAEIAKANHIALAMIDRQTEELTVQQGPFAGLKYPGNSSGSLLAGKILGTYESEIASWFKEAIQTSYYDAFIDIGCAEGYYAVGMAVCCPSLAIFAYDIDANARDMIAQLAHINHISHRLTIEEKCSPDILRERLLRVKSPLLLVDVEGYEDDLLDPRFVPELSRADIIVEIHEYKRPGCTYRLLRRFLETHNTDIIAAIPDKWKTADSLLSSDRWRSADLVNEGRRLPQLWVRLSARSRFNEDDQGVSR